MKELKIITKEKFTKLVLDSIEQHKLTAIDAVVYVSEKENLEIETVSRLIDKPLKEKIEAEAQELNLMKKTEKLPI